MNKQAPCCARAATQVHRAEAEVSRLARIMSHAKTSTRFETAKAQLEDAKRERAITRQQRIDHEAEHAGEPVPV